MMDAFQNSLRTSNKKVIKPVTKVSEPPVIIVPRFNNLRISNKLNSFDIIQKKKIIENSINKVNTFSLLPIRKVLSSLGKHVYIRIKPLGREKINVNNQMFMEVKSDREIKIKTMEKENFFTFDKVFKENINQEKLFNEHFSKIFNEILDGQNISVISLGEKGSGKTYTLLGDDLSASEAMGLLPRTINKLFDYIYDSNNLEVRFELKFSVIACAENKIIDLMNISNNKEMVINEDKYCQFYVENLTEVFIESHENIMIYLKCINERVTAFKQKGKNYSILYFFELTQKFIDRDIQSKFRFIDLCENKEDLESLEKTIKHLALNKNKPDVFNTAPFRNNKLTHLIMNSLFGKYKTFFFINCFADAEHINSTLQTINLAEQINKLEKTKLTNDYNEHLKNYFSSKTGSNSNPTNLNQGNLKVEKTSKVSMDNKSHFLDTMEKTNRDLGLYTTNRTKNNQNESCENIEMPSATKLIRLKKANTKATFTSFHVNHGSENFDEEFTKELEQNMKALETSSNKELLFKIESLIQENKDLIINNKKLSSFKITSEEFELKFKNAVKNMKELHETFKTSLTNTIKDENLTLKEIIQKKEKEALEEARGSSYEFGCDFFNFNCDSRLKILMQNFTIIMDTLAKDGNSYIYNSYSEIYRGIKFVVNEMLRGYCQNVDQFKTKDILKGQISETITIERVKYTHLKNSYSQLSILLCYYEKILFELLNKFYLDIRNFQLYENFTLQYQENISNLNKTINVFFDLFEKYKVFKSGENNQTEEIDEKVDLVKFYKSITKSRILNTEGLAKKISRLEEEISLLKYEIRNKQMHIENLVLETSDLKTKVQTLECSAVEYQKNATVGYEQVLENHIISFNILKNFYGEEINMAKNIIIGLNDIIEDFLIKYLFCNGSKDFYSLDANRKKFSDVYLKKAQFFVKDVKNNDKKDKNSKPSTSKNVLSAIQETFLLEEGNATKKMHLFLENQNQICVDRGLSCNNVVKGPMVKILKYTLEGDNNHDIWNEDH